MIIIAHRGNLHGPDPEYENQPIYIDNALNKGFHAEVDLYITAGLFFLGHNDPTYLVTGDWLLNRGDKLWIHCKNLDALEWCLQETEIKEAFWHEKDCFTLTKSGYIWTYPNKPFGVFSIVCIETPMQAVTDSVAGWCSDYPYLVKARLPS